jgi:hypothetical protein
MSFIGRLVNGARIDQNGGKTILFREHVVNQPIEKRWNAAARGSSTTVNND